MTDDTSELSDATIDAPRAFRLHGDAARLAVRLGSSITKSGTTLLIGGVGKNHGSAQIAARLGLSLVSLEPDRRVLLMDANLRQPSIEQHFGLSGTKGLAHAVTVERGSLDAVDDVSVPGLAILPALETDVAHIREILSAAGTPLLATLREHYDLIVMSGPDGAGSFEFAVWASHADHVVIAARQGVHKSEIVEARKTIEEAGSQLTGVVITYEN